MPKRDYTEWRKLVRDAANNLTEDYIQAGVAADWLEEHGYEYLAWNWRDYAKHLELREPNPLSPTAHKYGG